MTSFGFAVLVFFSFAIPVPILAWLDRLPAERPEATEKREEHR